MNTTTYPQPPLAAQPPAAARFVLNQLARLRHGTLSVQLPDGSIRRFGSGAPQATITLRNWNPCTAALSSGDIGLAESYMAGDWVTPSLAELLGLLVRNRREMEKLVHGSWFGRLAYRVKHLLNRNNRTGSRKNIHAHYDLGNAFYSLWLDDTMNYSSALFGADRSQPMADAQNTKTRRALHKAGVRTGD
ncbi:MAG: class I SAM-dependent methyltransferase, partial [Ramlibacter sp.]